MHETLNETLSALDNLIDEIDDWVVEHDNYFDPESNEELAARLDDIGGCLIEYGDAAIYPIKEYLYDTREYGYIIAVEVLQGIGTPVAIQQLIDALESVEVELCEYAAEALKIIGTPAIQPLIERITDRLDNPAVDENKNPMDVTYTLGVLSEIRDPRSFDFMVRLLDRFDDEGDLWNLAHLCDHLYNQHNPEIIPRLRAIAEKYGKKDTLDNVATEANDTIRSLLVDRVLESEDWMIYGCCCICKDYDMYEGVCRTSGEYVSYDSFCTQCVPEEEFRCDLCYIQRFLTSPDGSHKDGCDIYNLPPIDVCLEYSFSQGEAIEKFEITAGYREGSVTIRSDSMELSFEFHTVGDLDVLKGFFEGVGNYLADGVRFFVDSVDIFSESHPEAVNAKGRLIRGDGGNIVAVHVGGGFELELVLDSDTIDKLVSVIDTQRFLILCDTYTYMDGFHKRQDKLESELRQVRGLYEHAEEPEEGEELEAPPPPPCNHEFELLKTHKKYTVYRCTKCGETMKEFNSSGKKSPSEREG
ncbi:MAG: hypothetical protein U9N36_07360 [Euryarchaeota archaeon]|nr:hypothetical protein [Euryarchaeota archaeon]